MNLNTEVIKRNRKSLGTNTLIKISILLKEKNQQ